MKKISRYPGIEPFSFEHQDVFFGRDDDKENLFQVLINNKITVLFSKSGLGKSSLINAGLLPKIQKYNELEVFSFRLGNFQKDVSIPPTENILNVLGRLENNNSVLNKIVSDNNELWYRFKSMQISGNNRIKILIFDQFEELSTYPETDIQNFKIQISDLLYGTMPQYFSEKLQVKLFENPDYLSTQEIDLINEPLKIKILCAIRDDKMSFLNEMTDLIPDFLRNNFEIKSLNEKQTIEAITKPAQEINEIFSTSPFSFSQEAVKHIYSFLSQKNTQPIETTQLQLICYKCEQIIKEKNSELSNNIFEITPEIIPNFDNIFIDFYTEVIHQIPENEKQETQRFIEEELIISEHRITIDRLYCLDYISPNAIEILLKKHLIRSIPNTTSGISYEIAHDTLIKPILDVAKKRVEAEEIANKEFAKNEELRILKEKQENNEKEKRRQLEIIELQNKHAIEAEKVKRLLEENLKNEQISNKKTKKLIRIIALISIISIISAIIAIVMWQKSINNTNELIKTKKTTDSLYENSKILLEKFEEEEKNRKRAEINSLIQKARSYVSIDEIKAAIKTYEKALEIDSSNEVILNELNKLKKH